MKDLAHDLNCGYNFRAVLFATIEMRTLRESLVSLKSKAGSEE
jgi:hypothetical protein